MTINLRVQVGQPVGPIVAVVLWNRSLLVFMLGSTRSASVRSLSVSKRTEYARKLHLRTNSW
jgi:hypothetical protein